MIKCEFNQSKCKHCGKPIIRDFSDRFSTYLWTRYGDDRGTYFSCRTTTAEPE